MKFEVDTHTHTVLSGHAQSTLIENAQAAAKKGLKGIVLSDHGPCIQSSSPDFTIVTYRSFPRVMEGVEIYRSAEVNITDHSGGLDIKEKYLNLLDFGIAGLHSFVIETGGKTKDTDAVICAINNKYIDMIAHPDHPYYEIDYEAFIKETARLNKIVEVNENSIRFRKGSKENAAIFLKLCKKYDVRVAVSSDAHIAYNIGVCDTAINTLIQNDFPDELIVNLTQDRFDEYLDQRTI